MRVGAACPRVSMASRSTAGRLSTATDASMNPLPAPPAPLVTGPDTRPAGTDPSTAAVQPGHRYKGGSSALMSHQPAWRGGGGGATCRPCGWPGRRLAAQRRPRAGTGCPAGPDSPRGTPARNPRSLLRPAPRPSLGLSLPARRAPPRAGARRARLASNRAPSIEGGLLRLLGRQQPPRLPATPLKQPFSAAAQVEGDRLGSRHPSASSPRQRSHRRHHDGPFTANKLVQITEPIAARNRASKAAVQATGM